MLSEVLRCCLLLLPIRGKVDACKESLHGEWCAKTREFSPLFESSIIRSSHVRMACSKRKIITFHRVVV
jgi:hypothetical protein